MGWQKGQSGNPKGAPSRKNTFARLIREQTRDGLDLVEFAVAVFSGNEGADLAMRFDAMRWLADRGWGKAVETIVLEDESQREVSPQAVATERLETGLGPESAVQ